MKTRKTAVFISVLLFCTSMMTACGDQTNELLKLVDSGEFKEAYDYYDEKIDGSKKEDDICDEFADEMEDRYENITDMLFDGTADHDSLEDLFELLEDMDIDEEDYEEYASEWEDALLSKQHYEDAVDYIDDEDYSAAVLSLQLIDERDSNFGDAVKKIEELCSECIAISTDGQEILEGIALGMSIDEAEQALLSNYDVTFIPNDEEILGWYTPSGDLVTTYNYRCNSVPAEISFSTVDDKVISVWIYLGVEIDEQTGERTYTDTEKELCEKFEISYGMLCDKFGEGKDALGSDSYVEYLGHYEWEDTECGDVTLKYGTDLYSTDDYISGINQASISFQDPEYSY